MSRIGPQGGHYGAWGVLCAVPAVLASTCLVTILLSGLGRWTVPAVGGWLLAGPLLLLGPAERVAVRAHCRFRTPTNPEIGWLAPLRAETEWRSAAGPGRFDWYVSDDPESAALAVGRRSIAVSTGFLRLLYDGALTHRQAVAVCLHEAGHHVTGRCRYGLVVCWLTWPWQAIYRLSMRLGQLLPWASAAMVFLPVVFVIAFVNVARQDAPPERVVPVLALLLVLALAIFAHPVADAAVSRAGEHAADRYVQRLGAGADLAAALQVIAGRGQVSSWRRLRAGESAGSAATAGPLIGVQRAPGRARVRQLCQVVNVVTSRANGPGANGPGAALAPLWVCTWTTFLSVTAAGPVGSHGGRVGRNSIRLAWVRRTRVRSVDAG